MFSYEFHGIDLLLEKMSHFIRLNFGFVESFEGIERIVQSMMNFIDQSKLSMTYLLDHS
jgi:hypothetical protein